MTMTQLTEKEIEERQEWVDKRQAAFTARCEVCKGTGKMRHEIVPIDFNCDACDKRQELALVAELYWRNVPSEYRFATLSTLKPSEMSALSLERQQAVLDLIKAESESGYAFFGQPGIGKTVWTTALYGRALWRHIVTPYPGDPSKRRFRLPIWRITTKQMLDEHTAYATTNFESELDRRINQPTITAAKIAHVRMAQLETPRLFLEEIDKVKETESRRNTLFEMLDTLQANGGQLVINSNLHPEEFAERFGADMWWRIEKMTKVVSLF
jgi:DNA replication protein DnaC